MQVVMAEQTRKGEPERTCVGCRAKDARDALVHFAVRPEPPRLAPDPDHRLGGRGVSIHPRRACFEAAVRRGGLARALGGPVDMDAGALAELARSWYRRRIEGLLIGAARSKNLSLGTDAVREAMHAGGVQLLVVASDAAGRREELERAAERLGRACVVFGTKASLGRLLGRDEVGVVAIGDGRIAAEVVRANARATSLSEDG